MKGELRKLVADLNPQSNVTYTLPLHNGPDVDLNALIGKNITMTSSGQLACISCGKHSDKSYNQGHCFDCYSTLASCDKCIMQPEKCHYAQGTCREPQWGQENCLQKHYVYIAYSSGFKVGITRGTNIPSRWLDQGAVMASTIFEVSERLLSGLVEEVFKSHVADKTNWRQMLLDDTPPNESEFSAMAMSLIEKAKPAIDSLQLRYGEDAIVRTPLNIVTPRYPIGERVFSKVKNPHKFSKTTVLEGTLHGIKGQYLFVGDTTVNIRANAGYDITISVN